MRLTLRCPECQKRLLVPSKKVGQALSCPACDVAFTARVVATRAARARRKLPPAKKEPARKRPVANRQRPVFPLVTGATGAASRPAGSRKRLGTPPRKRRGWLGGLAVTSLLVVAFLLSQRPRERESGSTRLAESKRAAPNNVSTGDNAHPAKRRDSVGPASTGPKKFARWSTYHSEQGGFSVYLPDARQEKRHLRSDGLGLAGEGVQAPFVQLPNTADPIDTWPAIGEVWLRALRIDGPDGDVSSIAARLPAGATSASVAAGDLTGREFVFKTGNETHKARLFINGNRTILLTATFVGRESGDDGGVPFGAEVGRFFDSVRLDGHPVKKIGAPKSLSRHQDVERR